MNRFEIESLVNDISDRINYYKYEKLQYNEIKLVLANGETITLTTPMSSIAHLLGVDTKYLAATGIFKETNSWDLLNEMCNNEYRIYNCIKGGIISENNLFSDHITEKINGFSENVKNNAYDIMCLCKYDKSRYYADGNDGVNFGEYIMVKQNDKGEVFILGLTKKGNAYVPVTNQFYGSLEEAKHKLKKLFNKQSVTIVTGTITNSQRFLPPATKYKKVLNLINFIHESNIDADIDVSKDYVWTLGKAVNTYKNGGDINPNFAEVLSMCINSDELITPSVFGLTSFNALPSGFKTVVEAINSKMTRNLNGAQLNNGEISTHNGNVVSELEELKNLRDELTRTIDALKSENEELESTNRTLREQNASLSKEVSESTEIMRQIRNLIPEKVKEEDTISYYEYTV